MANLRDKGYPSAKSYRLNRSEKNNTVWTADMGISTPEKLPATEIRTPAQGTTRRERYNLLSEYNRRAIVNPRMPLISRSGTDYVTDDTSYANIQPNYYLKALANLLMNRGTL